MNLTERGPGWTGRFVAGEPVTAEVAKLAAEIAEALDAHGLASRGDAPVIAARAVLLAGYRRDAT